MSEKPEKYAIVGGGMLGITLALRLAQSGKRVTLFEASEHLGGLADAWKIGDVRWDRHYHVTLLSDSYTRKILDEVGLDEEMKWVETKTGVYADGKLHSLSSSWEFLTFKPLSLLSKFRLGLTIFAGSRIRNWKKLEKISVSDWLTKWSGKKVFQRFWLPLLRSKLGDNYKKTSAAFIWATIARLYAARRTGLKRELFGYLPGGYGRLTDALQPHLEKLGVDVRLNSPIQSVTHQEGQVIVSLSEGATEEFDRAVLTIPSGLVTRMLPQMEQSEGQAHQAIEYQGIVCASLLSKKPLADYYVTNITDGTAPFTGVIEMSALVDRSEFADQHLVYLPYYVPEGDPLFEQTDEQIQESSLAGLEAMYPNFSREDMVAFRVSRVPRVMPIPTLRYSEKLPSVQSSVRGVYVVNSAQIVNGTLNVNETVRLGENAAQDLLKDPTPHKLSKAGPRHVETAR